MKKESRDHAIDRANSESQRATWLGWALNASMRGELELVQGAMKHPAYKFYTAKLGGPTGGIFVTTFAPGGQSPDTTCESLDNAVGWARICTFELSPEMLARRSAIEAAQVRRERLILRGE